MSYDVVYTSCSMNQTSTVAHWGHNNLICFGNTNAVSIYDPEYGSGGKIIATLLAHSHHVNSTRWVSGGEEAETELISAAVDGKAILWSRIDEEYVPSIIAECKSTIIVADGYYLDHNSKHCVFAVASLRGSVNIYERHSVGGAIICVQNIDLGKHDVLALQFSRLPVINQIIFAVVTDKGSFLLYAEQQSGKFAKCAEMHIHSQWIRGLDFLSVGSELLFATAAQDGDVKVWKIKVCDSTEDDTNSVYDDIIHKNVRFKLGDAKFSITLDAILNHKSWIFSVNFNKKTLELLSSSIDKTLILWHKPEGSNAWIEKSFLGEMSSSSLGYKMGVFGPKGEIFACGFHGSFHLWRYSNETQRWEPAVTLGGHSGEVVDLAWEPYGQFIFSTSVDATTRIHAPWTVEGQETTWHEIARPQIHGHEMSSLAVLSRYEYVASAEEKVIRAFEAPRNFIDNCKRILRLPDDETQKELDKDYQNLPQGAVVPSLGLSNRAVYPEDVDAPDISPDDSNDVHFTPLELYAPPTEEDLLIKTLWPETHLLYGHGNDVFSLAATSDGAILASACKATTKEHACIILWETSSWVVIDKLESHHLTICQLAFSPNSKHLLSVSRDRRWTLFSLDPNSNKYKLSATTDTRAGIHTRIIWCCAWFSNSSNFVTGSRDGKVVIWKEDPNHDEPAGRYISAGSFLELQGQSVTALAVYPTCISDSTLIAVGLESGIIHLYLWNEKSEDNYWNLYLTINQRDAHHKTVRRLAFRSIMGRAGRDDGNNIIQLASCGFDGVVRVFDIKL